MAALGRVWMNKWITPPKSVSDDFSARNIIVTGATSGIGAEAVYKFAALGAGKVIMAARDLKKGEATKSALEARLGARGQLEVWELDMMDYASIAAFAKRANHLDHLDIVVLNAGTRRVPYMQSQYGWEEDLQVNTLSTVLLAILLLPKLRESKQHTGRTPLLQFVNSGLHQKAVISPEAQAASSVLAYYNRQEQFKEGNQYKFSKLFLMYATSKLADRTSSVDIIITSVCPGWVNTNLGRDHFFPGVFVLAFLFVFLFMRTASQGANTILSVTTQGEVVHGRFYQHDKVQPVAPSLAGPKMKQLGLRVWEEVIAALRKDVPSMGEALELLFPGQER